MVILATLSAVVMLQKPTTNQGDSNMFDNGDRGDFVLVEECDDMVLAALTLVILATQCAVVMLQLPTALIAVLRPPKLRRI